MSDEHSDTIIRLLEEIRELTKERNVKLDSLVDATRKRVEESLNREKEAQVRALAQRRRFLWTLVPLLLMALGWFTYVFWAMPRAEQRLMEQQMNETRMMQSNYLLRPAVK